MTDLFVTVASRRDWAFVRTLAASLARMHPDSCFLALSLDPRAESEPPEPFEVWDLLRLDTLQGADQWRFQRSGEELVATVLPTFLLEVLRGRAPERLIYLAARSLVLAPLDPALEPLRTGGAAGVLLPRILMPFPDSRKPDEADLRAAGVLSDAFIALRPCPETEGFLSWWAARMLAREPLSECALAEAPRQSLELALTCFASLTLLRDPTLGLSFWNLHERAAGLQRGETGELTLDGAPLRLVHFHGFHPDRIEAIAAGQTRFTLSRLPNLRPLFESYRAAVCAHGHDELSATPGPGERFDDGVVIPELARTLWRENPFLQQRFVRPFLAGPGTYRAWLAETVGPDGALLENGLPRLWHELWKLRPDLQAAFPDPWRSSRQDVIAWLRSGADPMGSSEAAFLPGEAQPQGGAPSPLPPAPPRSLPRRVVGALARRTLPKPLLDQLYFRAIGQPGFAPIPLVTPTAPPAPRRTPCASDLPEGLNIAGFLTGEFGLGEAGRSIVHAVRAARIPHVLREFRVPNKRYNDTTFTEFTEKNPYAVNLTMVNANELPMVEQAFGESWFAGRYHIGLWYWELPEFPSEWFTAFDRLDEVWVTSSYTAEALARISPVPVVKVANPIVIETERVSAARRRFGLPEDAFLFIFSFDFHSYLERKNPMAVAEAFRRAFGSRKDVGIVFKSINGAFYPEKISTMQDACDGLNMFLIEDYLDRYETFDLFKSCDALVSLHRAEGLGLGMAEAMALGVPVIATGYSGNMEFMNVNNSLPVRYRLVELEEDHGVYKKGQVWADPDIDHAAECMVKLVEDSAFARWLGEAAKSDMALRFSPEAAGAGIAQRLSRIREVR